jgi:hypothetical protein
LDVRGVVDGTTTVSLVFRPFELAHDTLALLQLILLLCTQKKGYETLTA